MVPEFKEVYMASRKPVKEVEPESRKYRNFPRHTLEETLVLPQKIQDEMGGKPMKRLLLANALGISPSSSNFRDLLSSSYKYELTDGTEKAPEIKLTATGTDATQTNDKTKRLKALRRVALAPEVFQKFFSAYADKKLPSADMLEKILVAEYDVPKDLADECAKILIANGKFVDVIRDITGSPHVMLDAEAREETKETELDQTAENQPAGAVLPALPTSIPSQIPPVNAVKDRQIPKAIFIGHGKNKAPLQQLQRVLTSFQIPHKVVVDEANLGRPIPQKVKDTMQDCGSAILIFTCDEKLYDEQQNAVWRPSENVVHELGAASFAYEDRIVIFKEKGLTFPTNFQSIGYIEFEGDSLEAQTAALLKELIGFGLVKITTT
jgi:predicted nucleotide-binding protein